MEEGFTALASSPPLIYSSIAAPLGVVQHLCRQVQIHENKFSTTFCFFHFFLARSNTPLYPDVE